MDYTKLVDLFLEGELSSVEKEILFRELSQNQELQEYFETQIQFNQLFQKDLNTITVPSDATNTIFASLSFKIPNSETVVQDPSQTAFVSFKRILSKYAPYFSSSVIGGIITFLLLWLLLPTKFPTTTLIQQNNLSSEQGIPLGVANEVPKIQASKEPIQTNAVDIEKLISKALENWFATHFQNGNIPNNFAQNSNQITEQNPIEPAEKKHLIQSVYSSKKPWSTEPTILPSIQFFSKEPLALSQNTNVLTQKLKNITLGFRGYMLKSNPDVNVNLTEKGILPNAGISIGYNVGKNTNIGFEFGQEKFSQKYTLNFNGEITYYKQNPLLWWYGFYLQQSISNLFQIKELKPMARVFIGGTPVGPLARGALGLQYTPDERVSLFFGWEGTFLGYKVQNNFYQTKKSGITYGVSVKY
ncbi:MAG: hypothetical protein N2560_09000 [Ignavibacteria bacterium]|nr:hypothetical protein [Ignavibacteria bacterium]